jgi:hypothetical protein
MTRLAVQYLAQSSKPSHHLSETIFALPVQIFLSQVVLNIGRQRQVEDRQMHRAGT